MSRVTSTCRRVLTLVCFIAAMVLGSASAWAVSPPPYEGSSSFPGINGPSDPEDYSWTVPVAEGQTLELIDEHHAEVFSAGHPSLGITAGPAHDAIGTTVPTSLSISEGNIVTVTVHHRAGNPVAGGAPFFYPILEGAGWEGGFRTEFVIGPKDEAEGRRTKPNFGKNGNASKENAASRAPPLRQGDAWCRDSRPRR